jgi:hypothetical protein
MAESSSVNALSLAVPLAALLACGDPDPYFREVRLDRAGSPACIEKAVRASIPGSTLRTTVDSPPPWFRAMGDKPTGRINTLRGGTDLTLVFLSYDEPHVVRYHSEKRQVGLEAIDAAIADFCHTRVELRKELCYRAKCP